MKNNRIVYGIYFLIIIIIIGFFYVLKYNNTHINSNIYNIKWYSYNPSNGYYDTIIFNNDIININISDISSDDYLLCTKYYYDKKNNELNLDYNKKIGISSIKDNKLVLIIEGKKKIFYNNLEETLNYEFFSYYNKTISEYKNDLNTIKEYAKININNLNILTKENNYSKYVFIGNNCSTIECSLSLKYLEKWIVNNKNIYYIDSTEKNDYLFNYFTKLDTNYLLENKSFNNAYPFIIILNNGKIVDNYFMKCNGFDCDKYNNNEF